MQNVKNFGDGYIISCANGKEVFIDANGTSSPIIRTESELNSAIKELIEGTQWEAERKESGKYFFTPPDSGSVALTLEVDFKKGICTVSFNGSEFKSYYLDKKNILNMIWGQMGNALAP